MPPPATVLVQAVLHVAAPRIAPLPHVVALLSDLLDASLLISPARAAASGSVRLLQRVLTRVLGPNPSSFHHGYMYSLSLEAAIKANDLTMVQTIHSLHPEPLEVQALQLAMAHGSLELVQWIVGTRHDRGCCVPGLLKLCQGCVEWAATSVGDTDRFRIGSWLISEDLIRAPYAGSGLPEELTRLLTKNAELMRWYDEMNTPLSDLVLGQLLERTIRDANDASEEILTYYADKGYTCLRSDQAVDALIRASCIPGRESHVELVLERVIPTTLRHHFV